MVHAPARAEPPQKQLKSVEKQLEQSRERQTQLGKEAEALAAEIAALRDDSVAAAKAAQEHEAELSALDERLEALNAEEAAKAAELTRQRARQQELLMALESN